jgi:Raf kinase inhibitor-like YbhB/YbcL family protein
MRLTGVRVFAIVLAMAIAVSVSIAQGPPAGGQGGGAGRGGGGAGGGQGRGGGGQRGPGLTLTSTSWMDGGEIPVKYAQAGMSVSPALSWSNMPMGTVEFALIMNDPEPVQRGSATADILHWMVVKIPATTTSIAEGAGNQGGQLPAGSRVIQAYRGPGAPAAGPPHHYTLTLYALNAPLELAENADRAAVMTAMEGKVLARGIFNGRYKAPAPPAQ